jgi:hypothetical protein
MMTAIAAIALRLLLTYWRQLLAGLGVIGALWWAYSAVYGRGYDTADNEWKARQQAAQAQAAADTAKLQAYIAAIDTGITIDMEAISNVRTVYRDKIRTVALAADRPDCVLVDGLLSDINAAAAAYGAAATGASGASVRPAKPAR